MTPKKSNNNLFPKTVFIYAFLGKHGVKHLFNNIGCWLDKNYHINFQPDRRKNYI